MRGILCSWPWLTESNTGIWVKSSSEGRLAACILSWRGSSDYRMLIQWLLNTPLIVGPAIFPIMSTSSSFILAVIILYFSYYFSIPQLPFLLTTQMVPSLPERLSLFIFQSIVPFTFSVNVPDCYFLKSLRFCIHSKIQFSSPCPGIFSLTWDKVPWAIVLAFYTDIFFLIIIFILNITL